MDHAAARRGSRGIYPPSPFPLELRTGCWGCALACVWLLAISTALVRGLDVVQAWQHLCGGGGSGFFTFPCGRSCGRVWAVGRLEPGCASPPRARQPAVCIFGVPVCVYLPCMCLRLYLSGGECATSLFSLLLRLRERGGDFCF